MGLNVMNFRFLIFLVLPLTCCVMQGDGGVISDPAYGCENDPCPRPYICYEDSCHYADCLVSVECEGATCCDEGQECVQLDAERGVGWCTAASEEDAGSP